jgi:predicted Zn-dependent peptidase
MSREIPDVTILVQMHGPSLESDTASTYAADVLFQILNDETSALHQRLVASGLFQSLAIEYLTLNDVGPITVHGKTTPARARQALLSLLGELDQLDALPGVTEDDLANAKKRREVELALTLEAAAALAPRLAFWWGAAGIDYYLTYHDRMGAQSLEDVSQFAGRYVAGQPRVIGILGADRVVQPLAEWLSRSASPRP